MNPVPLFLIIVTLPLLLGGCGEEESVVETKPVEEKQQEVKTEESVAETKPKLEGVNFDELELRGDFFYLKGSDTPYTGKFFELYENGQKKVEGNIKDGKEDGLFVGWHENGQKKVEVNYKDGKEDGFFIWWDENGTEIYRKNYKDGEIVKD